MTERRSKSRVRCRLDCTVYRGDRGISARVLDLSEGGLCLFSPVSFDCGEPLTIEIAVSETESVQLEAKAWHVRQVGNSTTTLQAWSVGMMISKAGDGYAALIPIAEPESEIGHAVTRDASADLQVFRVVVQDTTVPPTRVLTLGAASREEARELASADLGPTWAVLDVFPV